MSYSKKSTKDDQIELLKLIEAEKAYHRRRLQEGPGMYEHVLHLFDAINDPDTPTWKVKIYSELLEEPSPVMDLIRKMGMGRDEVESVQNMTTWGK